MPIKVFWLFFFFFFLVLFVNVALCITLKISGVTWGRGPSILYSSSLSTLTVVPTPTPTPTRGSGGETLLLSTPILTPAPTNGGFGGDPHFSIKLTSGEFLCFSLQGEHGFVFNLINSPQLQMNALFIPDTLRPEVTWFGSIGMVIKNNMFKNSNSTKLRFVADQRMVFIGDGVKLNAGSEEKLTFSSGKLTINETKREKEKSRPEIQVCLEDLGMDFAVHFTKNHLDMIWNNIAQQPKDSHGIIGMYIISFTACAAMAIPTDYFSF